MQSLIIAITSSVLVCLAGSTLGLTCYDDNGVRGVKSQCSACMRQILVSNDALGTSLVKNSTTCLANPNQDCRVYCAAQKNVLCPVPGAFRLCSCECCTTDYCNSNNNTSIGSSFTNTGSSVVVTDTRDDTPVHGGGTVASNNNNKRPSNVPVYNELPGTPTDQDSAAVSTTNTASHVFVLAQIAFCLYYFV